MVNKKNKVKKYFEIKIFSKHKWTFMDYIEFLFDNIYTTIIPFIIGFIIASSGLWYLTFFLIIPIYVKFKIKRDSEQKTKKIYIK